MERLLVKVVVVLAFIIGFPTTAVMAVGGNNAIYVSNAGSDISGDGTTDNPYQTLSFAVEKSSKGDEITLLSDLEQSAVVHIYHDLLINGNGFTVTRLEGFAVTSDESRSWYNPAMIEVHSDESGSTLTLTNITLDDMFRHEGTVYADQALKPNDTSQNINRVQDGIIALYNDSTDGNKTSLILEDGAVLQNFGGVNAVNLEGNSELIMKNGSVITNNGQNPNNLSNEKGQAVYVLGGGSLTMEPGSIITGIVGANAVMANSGTVMINGEITDCSGNSPIRVSGRSTVIIGEDGDIHDVTGAVAAIYLYGNNELHVYGKLRNFSGVGIYPSCNGGTDKVYIHDPAVISGGGQMAVQTNLQSEIYMGGGTITGNPKGVHVRKQSIFTMTGGTITGNDYGLFLNNKSTNTAKMIVNGGTVDGNNLFDYYIENTSAGSENGSYLYLSQEMLATNPTVGSQINNKSITIPANNGSMMVGNASNASKTALTNEANRLGLTASLTTWWFNSDQSTAAFNVAGLSSNGEPMFALYVPVDANGNPIGDVLTISAVDDTVIHLLLSTTSSNAAGYSVLLAQADVPIYTITIDYIDKDSGTKIDASQSLSLVQGSHYDITGIATIEIDGYCLYEAPTKLSGEATEDLSLISLYLKKSETPDEPSDNQTEPDEDELPARDDQLIPYTGDNITSYLLLFSFSVIGLAGLCVYLRIC